jgi:hypothetical protein
MLQTDDWNICPVRVLPTVEGINYPVLQTDDWDINWILLQLRGT